MRMNVIFCLLALFILTVCGCDDLGSGKIGKSIASNLKSKGNGDNESSSRSARPKTAILGHWKSTVGAPGMFYNKHDFEWYIRPHEKGLAFTQVWANGSLEEQIYTIKNENVSEKKLTLQRLFQPNETSEGKEKLADTDNYVRFLPDGNIIWRSDTVTRYGMFDEEETDFYKLRYVGPEQDF